MKSMAHGLIGLCLFLAAATETLNAQEAPEGLMAIHEAYANGDFDEVVRRAESFQESHPTHSLSDSIFVAKHLAVVYAANPRTREKGRYYMFRLLEMNPSADLVDMFVSEELDQTFEKVRKEFAIRQQREGRPPARTASAAPPTATVTRTRPPEQQAVTDPKEGGKAWLWITGGVVAAAAAVTVYFLTLEKPEAGSDHSI